MRTFVLAVISLALVACSGAPQDPAPAPAPVDSTTVQSACIDRITCLDGSEYCCLTAACMVANCEPPDWDSNTCKCKHHDLAPQDACIQFIQCFDGFEYCCHSRSCVAASCEPPQWDRSACLCH